MHGKRGVIALLSQSLDSHGAVGRHASPINRFLTGAALCEITTAHCLMPTDFYNPMPRQSAPSFSQPGQPAVAGADRCRVVEQAVAFFLFREAGEFRVQGMRGGEERFLAMQHRRVVALTIVIKVDLP